MDKYLLCVDNGLTSTKAVIFTQDGREIASSHCATVTDSKGDYSEIDMELQWSNTAKAIKTCIAKAGIATSNIAGVANSGHGAGLYCLDKDSKPVRKAISSMDARANAIIEGWKKEGRGSYDRVYQNLWSGQAIPILGWLKANEPLNYENIRSILMVKDWIIYRLTGNIGIEYTDASNSGLLNPTDKNVDGELLERFGLSDAYGKMPKLRKTTDIAGYITRKAAEETGLYEGTPVTGGVFDCIACALGSGVYSDSKYSIIAGTWNINSGIEKSLLEPNDTIKCSLFADIDRYFYVESSATSAVNLSWFMEKVIRGFAPESMGDKELHQIIEERLVAKDPWTSRIAYMPFLYKSHLSEMDGAFIGLKPEHDLFDMLLGIYEGVTFAHRKHIENLKDGGVARRSAVLSGGASKSPFWNQLFADVLNMEVATTEASEAGALGTAICASVALGIYGSFEEAIRSMVREKKRYYPDKAKKALYDEKYCRFIDVINRFER